MNTNPYPDQKIYDAVIEVFSKIGLPLDSLKYEGYSDLLHTEKWILIFKEVGSEVNVKFGLCYPQTYLAALSFVIHPHKYFVFEDYLTFKKDPTLKNLFYEYINNKPDELRSQYVWEFLKVVEQHVTTDLKKVALGQEWIDVPFDWESVGR